MAPAAHSSPDVGVCSDLRPAGAEISARQKMVLVHGNAPRSIGYQPIALLLSYTRENGPFTRTCTSISSFAGPCPGYWTMKRKETEPDRVWLRE